MCEARKTFAVLIGAGVLLFTGAGPAQAQVTEVTLRVNGLACPFCAYGLEKKLTNLDGFKDGTYKVKINQGKVSFGWEDKKPLPLGAIEKAVKSAGYTLKWTQAAVEGTLQKEDGAYFVDLPKPVRQRFFMYEKTALKEFDSGQRHKREGDGAALTEKRQEQIDRLIDRKKTVRIVGRVHRHNPSERPPAIAIGQLKALEGSKKRAEDS